MIVIAKIIFLNKQTNIVRFKYKLRGFYDFTLRNIAIGQYHLYRKQMKKCFFPRMRWFYRVKTISNHEKIRLFSNSAPSNNLKNMFGVSTSFQIIVAVVDNQYNNNEALKREKVSAPVDKAMMTRKRDSRVEEATSTVTIRI